jgi:hypothetical protein
MVGDGVILSSGRWLHFDGKKDTRRVSLYWSRVPDHAEVGFYLGAATNSVGFLVQKGFEIWLPHKFELGIKSSRVRWCRDGKGKELEWGRLALHESVRHEGEDGR